MTMQACNLLVVGLIWHPCVTTVTESNGTGEYETIDC